MPSGAAISTIVLVIWISACDGVGSPEGWLCTRTIAVADSSRARFTTSIVLVHNHPSGDPTPSQADIQMTRNIVDIATPLGIVVHDHIIVGKQGHASLKGLKLI